MDTETGGLLRNAIGVQESCLYDVGHRNRHTRAAGTFMEHWTLGGWGIQKNCLVALPVGVLHPRERHLPRALGLEP